MRFRAKITNTDLLCSFVGPLCCSCFSFFLNPFIDRNRPNNPKDLQNMHHPARSGIHSLSPLSGDERWDPDLVRRESGLFPSFPESSPFSFLTLFLFNQRAIFSPEEYAIESMRNNEISFEVFLESLRVALRSGILSDDVYVKLTKRDRIPYLAFQIKNFQGSQEVIVNHDVPVQMITAQRMQEITQPTLPDPKVQLVMPSLKSMQSIVDSMKNLGNFLTIRFGFSSPFVPLYFLPFSH